QLLGRQRHLIGAAAALAVAVGGPLGFLLGALLPRLQLGVDVVARQLVGHLLAEDQRAPNAAVVALRDGVQRQRLLDRFAAELDLELVGVEAAQLGQLRQLLLGLLRQLEAANRVVAAAGVDALGQVVLLADEAAGENPDRILD